MLTDCYSYMDLSELKNINEHLLTDNELFSYLFTLQFTHPFVIVCFEVFHCEIHGMVSLLQINVTFLSFTEMGMEMGSAICGDEWGWGQLYAGMDEDGDDLV